MTKYVIGPDVAIHPAHDEAVVRDEDQILAPTLLGSQMNKAPRVNDEPVRGLAPDGISGRLSEKFWNISDNRTDEKSGSASIQSDGRPISQWRSLMARVRLVTTR